MTELREDQLLHRQATGVRRSRETEHESPVVHARRCTGQHGPLPIFSYDRKRNSSPNPGSVRSNVGSSVGIVTSRFPIPVPPFVTIASQVHDACSTSSAIDFDWSFTTT